VGTTTSPYYEDKDMTGDDVKDYCYKVEATENNTDASSYSTILCLHQEPLVFIPNVFTPVNRDGLNDTFMPKGSYIASYQMQVYNRWGEEVFSGSNKGWDGRFHNSELPEGIYVYIITIHSLNGSTQILKGNLTLLQGK
jgi:gliding motility-associated-like protein